MGRDGAPLQDSSSFLKYCNESWTEYSVWDVMARRYKKVRYLKHDQSHTRRSDPTVLNHQVVAG